MQNNTYSCPIAHTQTYSQQGRWSRERRRDRWLGRNPQGEKFWARSISNSEQMIKLVSKLQSSWQRQMQTIFWQRKSFWCLNFKHKSQRHWAEINITVLIVISRMVVLITACMRQESPSYTKHFSVQLSTPHTLSSCISRHISYCRQSRLFRSKHKHFPFTSHPPNSDTDIYCELIKKY